MRDDNLQRVLVRLQEVLDDDAAHIFGDELENVDILTEREASRGQTIAQHVEFRVETLVGDAVQLEAVAEELKAAILSAGTLVEGKVFAKSDDLAQELCSKVNAISESGTKVIYYEALLEQHSDWMQAHFISSEAMLKELLQKNLKGFAFAKKYMAAGEKKTEKQSVTDEIKRIWGETKTCSVKEIDERLPYIPLENIWRVISGNSSFIWVDEGIYLLTDRFVISDDEADAILEYVETTCNKKGFASLSDVPREGIEEQNY